MAYDANYPADNLIIAQGPAAIRQKGADLKLLIDGLDSRKLDTANNVSTYGYHYRDVVGYSTTSGSGANTTGTLKITLPTSGLNTMLKIKIEGFNFVSGGGNWFIELQGYNNTSSAWQNTSAILSPNCPFTSVRFGHDGTKCCVLLGTTGTVWQFPQITISDVYASYGGYNQYATGWALSFITNETGITMSSTPNVKTLVADSDFTQYLHDLETTGIVNRALRADTLTTARTIGITGKVIGTAISFNGSSNISINTTAVTADNSDTVDGKHASDFAPAGYGLGGSAQGLPSMDLNTITDCGFYNYYGTTLNKPTGSSGFVLVSGAANYSVQIATDITSTITYTRVLQAGAWSAWRKLITDASEGFTQSLSANGWTKLPNGLIMQWGTLTSSISGGGTATITFPISFPNALLSQTVTICGSVSLSGDNGGISVVSTTNSSMVVQNFGDQAIPSLCFSSIGY